VNLELWHLPRRHFSIMSTFWRNLLRVCVTPIHFNAMNLTFAAPATSGVTAVCVVLLLPFTCNWRYKWS